MSNECFVLITLAVFIGGQVVNAWFWACVWFDSLNKCGVITSIDLNCF